MVGVEGVRGARTSLTKERKRVEEKVNDAPRRAWA